MSADFHVKQVKEFFSNYYRFEVYIEGVVFEVTFQDIQYKIDMKHNFIKYIQFPKKRKYFDLTDFLLLNNACILWNEDDEVIKLYGYYR